MRSWPGCPACVLDGCIFQLVIKRQALCRIQAHYHVIESPPRRQLRHGAFKYIFQDREARQAAIRAPWGHSGVLGSVRPSGDGA